MKETRVGDTITNAEHPCDEPLPGYKKVNPMVYCGLYPADGAKYPDLRDALEKLQLTMRRSSSRRRRPWLWASDSAADSWDCSIWRSYRSVWSGSTTDLVTTAPSVIYKIHKTDGEVIDLTNPTNMPDPSEIDYMEEPMVKAEIMVTSEYIGAIIPVPGAARHLPEHGIHRRKARRASLSSAAQRDHLRFLRCAEIPFERLCILRL